MSLVNLHATVASATAAACVEGKVHARQTNHKSIGVDEAHNASFVCGTCPGSKHCAGMRPMYMLAVLHG